MDWEFSWYMSLQDWDGRVSPEIMCPELDGWNRPRGEVRYRLGISRWGGARVRRVPELCSCHQSILARSCETP